MTTRYTVVERNPKTFHPARQTSIYGGPFASLPGFLPSADERQGVGSFKKLRILPPPGCYPMRPVIIICKFCETGVSCVLIASEINAPSSAVLRRRLLCAGSVICFLVTAKRGDSAYRAPVQRYISPAKKWP